jgi:hypothetical protein
VPFSQHTRRKKKNVNINKNKNQQTGLDLNYSQLAVSTILKLACPYNAKGKTERK